MNATTWRILDAIAAYRAANDFSPSIRDIMALADVSSTSMVDYHLGQLERYGYITRKPRTARSIRILERET